MKKINFNNPDLAGNKIMNRRLLIKSLALTGASAALLKFATTADAQSPQTGADQPEAENGHDYPMPKPDAKTEADFRNGVIGPATLSLMVSQIAVGKATNAKALEFAKFELREAIGVTTVLKSLGTPVPPMDATSKATLKKIQEAEKGLSFDMVYIKAQLSNHEFLRDLATSYLGNSAQATSMPETHGRHLAMLAIGQFKDHVVLTKDILKVLG